MFASVLALLLEDVGVVEDSVPVTSCGGGPAESVVVSRSVYVSAPCGEKGQIRVDARYLHEIAGPGGGR